MTWGKKKRVQPIARDQNTRIKGPENSFKGDGDKTKQNGREKRLEARIDQKGLGGGGGRSTAPQAKTSKKRARTKEQDVRTQSHMALKSAA